MQVYNLSSDVMANPSGVFVAVTGGEISGVVTTSVNRYARMGRIIDLAVSDKSRGMGIGKKLISMAISYFRKKKMYSAKIETALNNKIGRKLYPKFGFREIYSQVHFLKKL